jgi:hypothetical protein
MKKNFFSITYFLKIRLKTLETSGTAKYGKLDYIKQTIRFERCLYRARDTHSEYVAYISVSRKKYLLNSAK